MEATKAKILIIRFSSIGDIVLTSPIVRCIKNQLVGDVEIHYLTKVQYKSILEHNSSISKVFSIEKSISEVVEDLIAENFDYIIDLHKNLRSKQVIKKLNRISFTFDKLNVKKWLLTNFKINKLPNIHIVDRYFAAVKALGVINDGKGLEYFIPKQDLVLKDKLPSTHQNGYLAFAIGAQHATKRLPTHKIISICKKINRPIILLGGKEDEEPANEIVNKTGDFVYNACGNYNINQSASIVKQSNCLITHDTGLMHIGVALGVKVISVWGNTVPAFGMYPYYPNNPEKYTIIENKNLKCRPCSKIGYDKCPKKHFKCMEELNEELIVQSLPTV